jgi:hypothetical protein
MGSCNNVISNNQIKNGNWDALLGFQRQQLP